MLKCLAFLDLSNQVPFSAASLYVLYMCGIFIVAGVLHLREIYVLLYGVIYLLGLPAGYLILTIYTVCNITDVSWGMYLVLIVCVVLCWDFMTTYGHLKRSQYFKPDCECL